MRYFYTLAISLITYAAFAQSQLVKDLTNEQDFKNKDSRGVFFLEYKGKGYFVAINDDRGEEFYTTDGTPAGTGIFKDLSPGDASIIPFGMGFTGNQLFLSYRNVDGPTIAVTDGNPYNLTRLTTFGANSSNYAKAGNTIFFTGYDPDHNYEIWKSDGTAEGTHMIKDIYPGTTSSKGDNQSHRGMVVGNTFCFMADDGVHGRELWRTDGTEAGTRLLKEFFPGNTAGVTLETFAVVNGMLYIAIEGPSFAVTEIWKTDGTEANTVRVFQNTQPGGPDLGLYPVGDKILVPYNSVDYGSEWYTIDTNTDQLTLLKDINTGTNAGRVGGPVLMNGNFYFVGKNADNSLHIWKTDGTTVNTTSVVDITLDAGFVAGSLFAAGNHIFMSPTDNAGHTKLVTSDGTTTFSVVSEFVKIDNITAPQGVINNKLFFYADDGEHGFEPWVSDGTAGGTMILKDINTTINSTVERLTVGSDKKFVFATQVDSTQYGLWISDGTDAGTTQVKTFASTPQLMTLLNNTNNQLIFSADDGVHGREPWITNGTTAGTIMLKDIVANTGSSFDNNVKIAVLNGAAYFFTKNKEFWKTDGTGSGTIKIAGGFNFPGALTVFKSSLYYIDNFALWKSDGTASGTVKLLNFTNPGSFGYPSAPFPVGTNKMFFSISDDKRWEIWVSDGTAAGTHITKDIHTETLSFYQTYPQVVVNDVAYFSASTADDHELWRSDGTEQGTYLVKDVNPGNSPSDPLVVGVVGNTIYFTAYDVTHGRELWKTDGTTDGTVLVKDIIPGGRSSDPKNGYVLNGNLYFLATDNEHGDELWYTHGTESSTKLVADINPGTASAFIGAKTTYASWDKSLFFTAFNEEHGVEVWSYSQSSEPKDQTITFNALTGKKSDDAPFSLTATASSGLPVAFEIVSGPATITGNTLTITGAGTVIVKATQAGNNEYYEATPVSQTFAVDLVLGLEESAKSLAVWPNPATTTLSVQAKSMVLTDMLGRDVLTTTVNNETVIDVSHLPRGMYILKLKGGDQSIEAQKIILR